MYRCNVYHLSFIMVVHQIVARGRLGTLEAVLPILKERLGPQRLAELLNTQAGWKCLGTLDTALKMNKPMAAVLRKHGAVEQTWPEANWRIGIVIIECLLSC